LMNSIAKQNHGADYFGLAGTGFRDFTRIAASDPQMWHDIFLANRTQMLAQLDLFKQTLQGFETSLQTNDSNALEAAITKASQLRSQWHIDNSMSGEAPIRSKK
jgi:prephenate dehydrogenase